ncbi:hypothetical protein A3J41_02825 [candidate division TM6 bacterium RIFCSPHIGHO2_12_FULL_38_8]|nr:MAG: hypothetical protein A3J41_02825 [candidate division TM6 bacterium RIFCSPHIGHO2_12_FULL_38_8]
MKKYILISLMFANVSLFSIEKYPVNEWIRLRPERARAVWRSLNDENKRLLLLDLFQMYRTTLTSCFRSNPLWILNHNCDVCMHYVPNASATFDDPIWQDLIIRNKLIEMFNNSFDSEEYSALLKVHENLNFYIAELQDYADVRNRLLIDIAQEQDLIEILQAILAKENNPTVALPDLFTGDRYFAKILKNWIVEEQNQSVQHGLWRDIFHPQPKRNFVGEID